MSDPTETAAHSDDTYMLYFELEDVEFSCDKLQKIDSCPVIIEVQFLDYPAFNLVQEESACPGRFLNFRPHQSFNLKSPKSSCPCSSPELEFNFFRLRDEVCACEHIFSIQLPFDEDQRKSLRDFVNKCAQHSTSFSTSGRYKLTDRDGVFSGCMTVRLRYIRCEDCPAAMFPNPIPWKDVSRTCSEIKKSLHSFHHLSSAERLNFPEFRDLIYQNCLNDSADWNFLCNIDEDTDSNESLCSECKDDDDDSCGSPLIEKSSGIKVLSKKHPAGERVYECFQPDYEKTEELLIVQDDSPVKLGTKPVKTKSSPKITVDHPSKTESKDAKVDKSPTSTKKNKSVTTLKSKKRSEMTVNTKSSKASRFKKDHKSAKEKGKKHQGRPEKSSGSEPDDPRTAIRKMKNKFVYNVGDFYPGFGRAHQHCVDRGLRVPAKMGWKWNVKHQVGNLKPRKGWRPGALNRLLREIIQEAKAEFIEAQKKHDKKHKKRPKSAPHARRKLAFKRSKTSIRRATPKKVEETFYQPAEISEIPPTLKLQRKNGKYHITMCPVKKEDKTARIEPVPEPIEFTIERDEDDTSSTASDMEIEYSVPTAIERYRKKPNVVHVDLQVKQADILNAFKPPAKNDKAKKTKGKKAKKGKKKK